MCTGFAFSLSSEPFFSRVNHLFVTFLRANNDSGSSPIWECFDQLTNFTSGSSVFNPAPVLCKLCELCSVAILFENCVQIVNKLCKLCELCSVDNSICSCKFSQFVPFVFSDWREKSCLEHTIQIQLENMKGNVEFISVK